jgi:hypothetical protein
LQFDVHILDGEVPEFIDFTIQTKELEFCFQPHELTESEVEDGANERPDNVKGSYAVYHASKANNKYRTGKAFHLYRPQITDSQGLQAWCEISLDLESGTMRAAIPNEFRGSAVLPVVMR